MVPGCRGPYQSKKNSLGILVWREFTATGKRCNVPRIGPQNLRRSGTWPVLQHRLLKVACAENKHVIPIWFFWSSKCTLTGAGFICKETCSPNIEVDIVFASACAAFSIQCFFAGTLGHWIDWQKFLLFMFHGNSCATAAAADKVRNLYPEF